MFALANANGSHLLPYFIETMRCVALAGPDETAQNFCKVGVPVVPAGILE